jgi:hypothetical protein
LPPPGIAPVQDRFQYAVHVPVDVLVGKADDVIASLVEPRRARGVVFELCGVGVAVNLDDQPAGSTVEINDKAADRVLATELDAAQLPVAQARPEFLLSRRLRLAQLTRPCAYGWVHTVSLCSHWFSPLTPTLSPPWERECAPHPNPLPPVGEGVRPSPPVERECAPHPNPLPPWRGSCPAWRTPLSLGRERGRG